MVELGGGMRMQESRRRREACDAGASQRHVRLLRMTAQPFDLIGGAVTDAIDGKEGNVGLADQAGEQTWAVLDAAIVAEQNPPVARGQCAELVDEPRRPPT